MTTLYIYFANYVFLTTSPGCFGFYPPYLVLLLLFSIEKGSFYTKSTQRAADVPDVYVEIRGYCTW